MTPSNSRGSARSAKQEAEFPKNAVRSELSRILASPDFEATDRLRKFLRFLVEETLAGRGSDLKGYTIATCVFGRKDNFDPATDPVVRIQASRLRRRLERYYLTAGKRDPMRIEIAKGGYVASFKTKWAELPQCEFLPPVSPETFPSGPSIAVMPIRNLSDDPKQSLFAEGLTEELTSELARHSNLAVLSTHSTLAWSGHEKDACELGRMMSVRFLLEGSVRKEGDAVKVSIRLVETASGTVLWVDDFLRDFEAVACIGLEEEIATTIAVKIGKKQSAFLTTTNCEDISSRAVAADTIK